MPSCSRSSCDARPAAHLPGRAHRGTIVVVPLLILVVGVLVVGAAIAVVAGGRGGGLGADGVHDRAPSALVRLPPEGTVVDADDLEQLRFSVVLRGYRAEEVEAVLDRLAEELAARDRRIAELSAAPYGRRHAETGTGATALASSGGDPLSVADPDERGR